MSTLDTRIMARVRNVHYYTKSCMGILYMADGDCCDMDGAIELFTGIDPAVRKINTFSGKEPDTIYYKQPSGEWTAYTPEEYTMACKAARALGRAA